VTQTPSAAGRLVALCGIDASGKATQTDLLAARARTAGLTVHSISFPRYGQGFFADLIERYLQGEFAERAADVSPFLASLPYACDRWEAANEIRRWLAAGALVLCNRYVPANMAHQGSKIVDDAERREFIAWEERLEYEALALPRPDLHILLDVPTALAERMVRRRNAEAGRPDGQDIHERDSEHLARTAAVYRELAAADPERWRVVTCAGGDALLPREEIADSVWSCLGAVLYNR